MAIMARIATMAIAIRNSSALMNYEMQMARQGQSIGSALL